MIEVSMRPAKSPFIATLLSSSLAGMHGLCSAMCNRLPAACADAVQIYLAANRMIGLRESLYNASQLLASLRIILPKLPGCRPFSLRFSLPRYFATSLRLLSLQNSLGSFDSSL